MMYHHHFLLPYFSIIILSFHINFINFINLDNQMLNFNFMNDQWLNIICNLSHLIINCINFKIDSNLNFINIIPIKLMQVDKLGILYYFKKLVQQFNVIILFKFMLSMDRLHFYLIYNFKYFIFTMFIFFILTIQIFILIFLIFNLIKLF